jgi:peptide/nickel transport system permease protein
VLSFVGRRVLLAIPMLVLVSFLIFLLVDLTPGDAAESLAPENASEEQVEAIRERFNLDDPVLVRYVDWLGDAVTGDLGTSLATGEPVNDLIFGPRLAVTFSLALVALVLTVSGSLVLGIIAAVRAGKLSDRAISVLAAGLVAAPSFWIGMVLVLNFALEPRFFGIQFPAIGYRPMSDGFWTWLNALVLPGFALAALPLAELTIQLRASLIDVGQRDFILATRAKGLRPSKIVVKHGLKNAAIPVVTVLGFRIAQLLGGSVIIEQVFVLPGLGTLAINSVLAQDVPVLLGLVLLSTIVVLVVNVLVDLSYGYFNPKVRTS